MMKMFKSSQLRFVAALAALVGLVVVAGAVAVSSFVLQAVSIYYVPDTAIVSVYLICLLALWQLVVWITPSRRRQGRRSVGDAPAQDSR